jgi:hypothetical protein
MSTSNIAARLQSDSAKELVLCAMVNLQLMKNQKTQKRKDILNEMKTATVFFKATMTKNLTNTLRSLIKSNEINEISMDEYSLSSATVNKFKDLLSDDE